MGKTTLTIILSMWACMALTSIYEWSGTISAQDPTFQRPNENGMSQSSQIVAYDVQMFWVDTSGVYTWESAGTDAAGDNPYNNFVLLYKNIFLPGDPLSYFEVANDNYTGSFAIGSLAGYAATGSAPPRPGAKVTHSLESGRQYFAVTTSNAASQYGAYRNAVEGSGEIHEGTVPEPSSGLFAALLLTPFMRKLKKG